MTRRDMIQQEALGPGWYMAEIIGICVANPTLPVLGWDGDGAPVYERVGLTRYHAEKDRYVGNDVEIRYVYDKAT